MGFCLFGVIGWCEEETKVKMLTKQQTDIVKETITENFSNIVSTMQFRTAQIQKITCIGKETCIIDGVKMKQMSEVDAKGSSELQKSVNVENLVNESIDKSAHVALDLINKNTGGNRKTFTENEMQAITSMKTQLRSTIRSDIFASCVVDILQEQSIYAKADNVVIRAIEMDQTIKLMAECVIKIFVSFVNKVKNDSTLSERLKQENKIENKGLLDNDIFFYGAIAVGLLAIVVIYRNSRE